MKKAERRLGFVYWLVAVLLMGCEAQSQPPSIVLWVVDTLRADRLGMYGGAHSISPNYDAFAQRATVFDAAMAQSSWTRPTVATILTGVSPLRHGVRDGRHSLAHDWQTLPESLKELGYETAFFFANGQVGRKFGFDQGFDMFWYEAPTRTGPDGAPPTHGRAARLVDAALDWLDGVRAASDRPFFIVFLSIEPHDGYEPAEPFRSRLAGDITDRSIGTVEFMRQLRYRERASSPALTRDLFRLYDAEIAWNDQEFGRFRREIAERDLDPVIVVTADHGEQFGEHGHFGHLDLHQETLRIPFTVRVPGQSASRRVEVPVQQADLFPTLIDLAGGETSGFDGQSLVPLLAGQEPEESGFQSRPIVSMSRKGSHTSLELGPFYSLVLDRWKLIWTDRRGRSSVQLFDRVNDPDELVDLGDENPMLTRRLLRTLQEEIENIENRGGPEAVAVTIDEETRRQLEALGYVD